MTETESAAESTNAAEPTPSYPKALDTVLDGLAKRVYGQGDRKRLRDGLDKAEAPPTGRDASDAALGRISRGPPP